MYLRQALILLCVAIAVSGCNHLRESEAEIVERLLAESPLGSSKEVVRRHLATAEVGPLIEEEGPAVVPLKEPFQTQDWRSLFRVRLGGYGFMGLDLFSTDVVAFYIFDRDDELVEIAVVKYHESL